MKYIMLKHARGELEIYTPIIFPVNLIHKHVAESMLHCLGRHHNIMASVHSAGFIDLSANHCYGESETLKVKSQPGDSVIISSYDNTYGIYTKEEENG